MTTMSTDDCNTELWTKNVRMWETPNWHGVSPEVIARRGRPWNRDENDIPWLDRDDAAKRIDARLTDGTITTDEAQLLHQWVTDGYFILRGAVPPSDFGTIDQFNRDLDDIWTADKPIDDLQIMSLHIPGRRPGPISHAELLEWPLEKRIQVRDSQLWRVHYWHCFSQAAMKLSTAPRLLRMATLILDEPATLVSYIGFKWGSQVGVHQDVAAMHIHPKDRLVGVWLAGEDVDPQAGPLSVYRGSHRVPMWSGWNNYPQTNLRSARNNWDFWTSLPEALHQITIVMSDRGIPASYRTMHGFGSHTFSFINARNERHWVKFHLKSMQGIKNLTNAEAEAIIGKNRESHQRDLFDAIRNGDFPKWKLYVQVMPEADAAKVPYHPFDLTKVWPHKDYPPIEVGVMELNRNPANYFAEVEQAVRAAMGESADAAALQEGRKMNQQEAVAYALEVAEQSTTREIGASKP